MVRRGMIQRILLLLFVVTVLSLSVTSAGASRMVARADLDAVDDYIRSEMRELRIPGVAVAIVSGDQVVYTRGFGTADASGRPVTAQTPMLLGSVSKGITALAVMQLVEAGKLDLDASVQRYLPWFRVADSSRRAAPGAWTQITLRQLLHHTSGIAEYAGADTWGSRYAGDDALERQVRSFAKVTLLHTLGEVFEYSNANYQILGLIVQVASDQSYESYIEEHIFRPLDMRHSYALAAEASGLATGYRYWFGWPLSAASSRSTILAISIVDVMLVIVENAIITSSPRAASSPPPAPRFLSRWPISLTNSSTRVTNARRT